jgi:alpha-glucosidase
MLADAHDIGIKVIVDLVPNHTSSEHPWFRAALTSAPGSPERERYIFRSGRGKNGELPPTNWHAVFGGSAWERVPDGEWYLHLFDPTQPDLNWDNEEVRAEFDDIFRFWLDRGVDGFRIDVAHGLIKDPSFPDLDEQQELLGANSLDLHPHWDREGIHDVNRRWRRILDECDREVMMVAEAWVRPDRLPFYLRADEYHQSFNFDFLGQPWDRKEAIKAIDRATTAAAAVGSTPTWTLSNHDVMRHATRYGLPNDVDWRAWPLDGPHDLLDPERGLRRARAATMLLMALPGSIYIYQGEELGLPEAWDLPTDVLDDPVWENSGHKQKGRDGCRVPIPWKSTARAFGFGDADPWLPQPPTYAGFAADVQTGVVGSTLEMYRAGLALRREFFECDESLTWIDLGADVLAFERGSGVICAVNYGKRPVPVPTGQVLLSSTGDLEVIAPEACVWVDPAGRPSLVERRLARQARRG